MWLQLGAAILVTMVIHEGGHALIGSAAGMRLTGLRIGPFHWDCSGLPLEFQVPARRLAEVSGGSQPDAQLLHGKATGRGCAIAAGPFANLVLGSLAAVAALTAKGSPYQQYWDLLYVLASINLVTALSNLVPLRPQSAYSDGARIFQLFRGGPLASYFRAAGLAHSTRLLHDQPRDYDLQALEEASSSFKEGSQGIFLRLAAAEHFLDRGDFSAASTALTEAEEAYRQAPAEIQTNCSYAFLFHVALLHRDPVAAREWWQRIESSSVARNEVDDCLAHSALAWVEGRMAEALRAWEKGFCISPCRISRAAESNSTAISLVSCTWQF